MNKVSSLKDFHLSMLNAVELDLVKLCIYSCSTTFNAIANISESRLHELINLGLFKFHSSPNYGVDAHIFLSDAGLALVLSQLFAPFELLASAASIIESEDGQQQ